MKKATLFPAILMISAGFSMAACSAETEATASGTADIVTEASVTSAKTSTIKPVNIDAPSGLYEMEKTHAYITFSYDHQGYSKPWLRWRAFDGTLNFDADNPTNSTIDVEIQANSIDSGVDIFDEHLRDPGFFDVEKFPTITFKSKKVTLTGKNTGKLIGDLTIKDFTNEVTLDVTFNKAGKARGSDLAKLGFSASGMLERNDYGSDIGKYVPFVGNDVTLTIEVEMIEKAAE